MSKRAEQKALEAYPKVENGKIWTSTFGVIEVDKYAPERKAFQKGYEQAEKDLCFSPEDEILSKWSDRAKEALKPYFANPKSKYAELFVVGYMQAEKDFIALVKQYIKKGERCMEQEGESQIYAFWDGFHNCAENILRELEKE